MLPDANELEAQHISNTLWSLGKIAEQGKAIPLTPQATTSICKLIEMLPDAHKLGAQHISNALWSLGKLAEQGMAIPLTPQTTASICRLIEMLPDANKVGAQEISNTLWSLGKLAEQGKAIPLTSQAMASICRLIEMLPDANKLDAQAIANTLWSLGKLAEQGMAIPLTSKAMASICRLIALLPDAHKLGAQHISNTLWGLSRIEHQQGKSFQVLYKLAEKYFKDTKNDEKHIRQTEQAIGYCVSILKLPMQSLVESNKLCIKNPESSKTHRDIHKQLVKSLNEKAVVCEMIKKEYYVYGWFIDTVIITANKKYAIEIDNVNIHYDKAGKLRYQDAFRDKILQGLGWEIHRIKVGTKENIQNQLNGIVNKIAIQESSIKQQELISNNSHKKTPHSTILQIKPGNPKFNLDNNNHSQAQNTKTHRRRHKKNSENNTHNSSASQQPTLQNKTPATAANICCSREMVCTVVTIGFFAVTAGVYLVSKIPVFDPKSGPGFG